MALPLSSEEWDSMRVPMEVVRSLFGHGICVSYSTQV